MPQHYGLSKAPRNRARVPARATSRRANARANGAGIGKQVSTMARNRPTNPAFQVAVRDNAQVLTRRPNSSRRP